MANTEHQAMISLAEGAIHSINKILECNKVPSIEELAKKHPVLFNNINPNDSAAENYAKIKRTVLDSVVQQIINEIRSINDYHNER